MPAETEPESALSRGRRRAVRRILRHLGEITEAPTAASGTFTIGTTGGFTLDMDVTLTFPGGGGLTQTVQASVTSCNANCTPRCGS